MGKVVALVIGLSMLLAAPAGAWTYENSWSSTDNTSPFGLFGGLGGLGGLNSFNGPFGPFGLMCSSPFGYSGFGNSPYGSYYSTPTTMSNSLLNSDILSDFGTDSAFGDLFGSSLFKAKEYGTPPAANITKALVGQKLPYNAGYMSTPLQFQIDESDIGAISGTQYKGADAWKARVGQQGIYWDVILDETGSSVLSVAQV